MLYILVVNRLINISLLYNLLYFCNFVDILCDPWSLIYSSRDDFKGTMFRNFLKISRCRSRNYRVSRATRCINALKLRKLYANKWRKYTWSLNVRGILAVPYGEMKFISVVLKLWRSKRTSRYPRLEQSIFIIVFVQVDEYEAADKQKLRANFLGVMTIKCTIMFTNIPSVSRV